VPLTHNVHLSSNEGRTTTSDVSDAMSQPSARTRPCARGHLRTHHMWAGVPARCSHLVSASGLGGNGRKRAWAGVLERYSHLASFQTIRKEAESTLARLRDVRAVSRRFPSRMPRRLCADKRRDSHAPFTLYSAALRAHSAVGPKI
jgi:hypothetical protein